MTNVRTIHVDWYNQRPLRSNGGPQLAFQGDHLSNMVVFDNAPELPNYYLLVEMKTDDAGIVDTLPAIQLEGPYWVIPNYYTQICQQITFQVCCKTETGDYEHHSAKFKGTILPVLKHNGEPIDQSPMFDPYIDILDKRVNELIITAGDIQIDSELKSDSTNPVQNKVVKAAIDEVGENISELKEDLNNEKEERNQAVMNSSDGVYNLGMYSDFVNGTLIDGVVHTNQNKNRISSVSIITATKDIIIRVANGFAISVCYFVDGTYSSTTGWVEKSIKITANSTFRCMIGRVSEISEVADILTFLNQVTVATDLSMLRDTALGCGFYAISGWVYGRYLKCNVVGSVVNINSPTWNAGYKHVVVPCSAGDKFTINGTGGGNPRLWAFLDASYEVLTNSDVSASASNLVLTAPTNAAYLIINDTTDKISFIGVLPVSLAEAEHTEMVSRTKGIVDLKLTTGKSDSPTGKWYWTTIGVTNAKDINIVSKGDTLHTNWADYYITYVELNNDYTVKRWHQISSDTYIPAGVIYRLNVVQRSGNATTQAERDAMIAATYATTDGYASNMSVDTDEKRLNLIEEKLSDEFLPDYAEAGAKRIIGQLKAKSPDGNLLVFGFNTDQHISYPRDAMPINVTPVLTGLAALKKITQGYPMDFICLGGDGVVASETDIAHILDSCVTIQTPLQGASCPIVPLTGNHDAAQNNANITGAMLFNAHFKRVANSGFLDGWDNTHTNGYWESKSHKCRVIFLDDTLRTDYTAADRSAALTAMLADVPDDYRIIIFSHHPISSALKNDGWFNPLGLQSIIQPYASQIICCISGHGHMDESETSDGILYIGTTMAAYGTDQEGNSRTLNTENETAYDVFCIDESNNIHAFRYGYGEDRSWFVE